MRVSILILLVVAMLGVARNSVAEGNGAVELGAIPGEGSNDLFLSSGFGLALFDGNTGWAFNVGGLKSISDEYPLFAGLDGGLNFWNFDQKVTGGPEISGGATGVQLLPTIVYRFGVTGAPDMYPYVGLSAGPHVYIENTKITAGGMTREEGDTSLFGEALFRTGLYYSVANFMSLNPEVKLGILRSQFILLPQVNAVFGI